MKKPLRYLLLLATVASFAQSTYTSANYAAIGNSFYLTNATNLTFDFATTGTNHTWDFSTLTGISQQHLEFRNPTQTGFNLFTFPYIFNSNNTNLSSTDGTANSIAAAGQTFALTDRNDYFKKTTTELKQTAASYKFNYNGTVIPITSQYATADVVYNFPLNFGDTNTGTASVTTNIPTLFYENKTVERTNTVDGWGSITTPYGTFSNTLRVIANLVENDTVAFLGVGVPRIIRTTRELKWLDPSRKYPVMVVTQANTNGTWATTNIQYLDDQRDFQIIPLFLYSPLAPTAGATVNFQNLSTNGTAYSWDFGDPSSGTGNTSTAENPTHIFNANGTYQVTLTVSNPTFSNSITIPVVVGIVLAANENQALQKMTISPNPFRDHINVSRQTRTAVFALFSVQGKIIYSGDKLSDQDFSQLASGLYVLKIVDDTQSEIIKLIKE